MVDEDMLREALDPKRPQAPTDVNSDDVAQVYRRLRESFERDKRYHEAGDLFIGEMESMRLRPLFRGWFQERRERLRSELEELNKGTKRGGLRRAWVEFKIRLYSCLAWLKVNVFTALAWYKHLGLYGESYVQPILWSLLTVSFFAFLKFQAPVPPGEPPVSLSEALLASLLTFFQLQSKWGFADLS